MQTLWNKTSGWLLPAVLILFIFQVLLMPLAVGLTYSDRPEEPGHTLTYQNFKLKWDDKTVVRSDGTAELRLFDHSYDGTVTSSNGDSVIAPGTTITEFVRLRNRVNGPVMYTAVLYEINDHVPQLEASMDGKGLTDTVVKNLPQGITQDQVIRAVRGKLPGKQFQDFDINWHWSFEDPENLDARDRNDTALGNAQQLDEVTLGLYIVVEDNNVYVTPKTGDESPVAMYLTLLAIALLMVVLLVNDWRRERLAEVKSDDEVM